MPILHGLRSWIANRFVSAWWMLAMIPIGHQSGVATMPSFQAAQPGYVYEFPRDHGSHDAFVLEWWYVTGHVFTADHRRFGYELTFFRRAVGDERVWQHPSRWAIRQVYLAHAALTDAETGTFRYDEKLSRAALGKAGAESGRLETWIDNWFLRASRPDHGEWQLSASADDWAIDFTLRPLKSPVIHGPQGISLKGQNGEASHYYSITRLQTTGHVRLGDDRLSVKGESWMDHEFGAGTLSRDLVGWDWFSVQFENRYELMVYWLRRADGTFDAASSGTLVFPDGTARNVPRDAMRLTVLDTWMSPHSGARYPIRWRLEILPFALQIEVTPVLVEQELRTSRSTQVTYWEGAVDIQGTMNGDSVRGRGYVELTGYAEPLQFLP
ncbi:MAG: carotenoid 1,2-hydratase [Nitrospirae bacterium]|nr:MAG: carotenoid 1,2-hydratase [Nitrospirota bacterium]